MELDSFLASPRWDIIQIIAQNPSSPIEIAAKVGTTVSFISQQLKLLEAAGIVSKKRTGLVEKGKPRTLFSLSREIAYIVPLSKAFTSKRTITLTSEHKITLKIWELQSSQTQVAIQRAFWSISKYLDQIAGLYVSLKNATPELFVLSTDKSLLSHIQKIKGARKKADGEATIRVISSFSDVSRIGKEFFSPIFDPSDFFETSTVLKGGVGNDE